MFKKEGGLGWVDKKTGENWVEHKKPDFSYYPVCKHYCTISVSEQDVRVKSSIVGGAYRDNQVNKKRGRITKFSKKSKSRLELHIRNVPVGSLKAFLTLTYPENFPCDGILVKKHLKAFREWLRRRSISGVWFLEFQARGAPHFHAFLDHYIDVSVVSNAWCKIVNSGDEKHLKWHLGLLSGRPCIDLFDNPHAASAYACKYAAKQDQKNVPDLFLNVGRFWGCFGGLRPIWSVMFVFGEFATIGLHRLVEGIRSTWGVLRICRVNSGLIR